MTVSEILAELKSLRNETMFALNSKNGAGNNQFGVKLGDIRTVAKKVKVNHPVALTLWKTGKLEARLLAILIMKPTALSKDELDEMVRAVELLPVADWFNAYIIKDHPAREAFREKWMDADNKWAARAGWSLTAGRVARDPAGLDMEQLLDRVEAKMPAALPEVQWTMNTTLAQIGINFREHRDRAIGIGEKLGIYRDYPVSKGCTSPFAPVWIGEMVRRQG